MFRQAIQSVTASVLCVETDGTLLNLLNSLLASAGYDIIQVADAQAALQTVSRHSPDLVLLDVRHCGGDGMDLCRRLRADRRSSRVPLILISEDCDETDRVLGFEFGADDFVQIPFGRRELLARIKSLLRRSRLHPSEVLNHGDLLVDAGSCRVEFRDKIISLTPSEFKILHFLLQSPGQVFSREKIMDAVHCDGPDAMERSVDPHINTIRRKLGEGGALIETVRGFGYRIR
jgi:two-component system phosphate regulon response regulator PhoB